MKKEDKGLKEKLYELFQQENDALIAAATGRMQTEGMPIYSSKYYQRMKELKQQGTQKERRYVYFGAKAVSKAAVAALLIWSAAIGSATVYGITHLSEPAILMHQDGMNLTYHLTPEELEMLPSKIEATYAPEWLPEGYTLYRTNLLGVMNYSIYQNESGTEEIMLLQTTMGNVVQTYDTEGISLIRTEVDDYPAYYFEKQGFATLLWSDGEYHYDLKVSEAIGDDIWKIAESLKPVSAKE